MSEANTILSNFFVLKELKLLKTNLSTGELELESISEANQCPHCQNFTNIKYDKRIVIIRDCPLRHGQHPIYLKIHKKRFRCSSCKKVFTEKLPGIIPRRRTTERFQRQIMFACDRYAHLNQVRKDFFVSSDFVYRAFYEKLELKRRKDNQYAWPKCIGIDEHGFGRDKVLRKKVFVTMVVNHNRKKLMEVVFGKSSQNLKDRLSHIPGRENVRFATIDMCDPYRNFILNHFPYAEIVADKFHVLRLLSPSIMKERKLITGKNADRKARGLLLCNSKNLDYFDRRAILDYLPRHPKLNALYHAKEALHNFYRIKGYTRAVVALGHMITRFKSSHYEEISRLGRTLENWKSEIQNYFKTRLTNARLEGFNNKASLVRRRAFGYKNPNNYRLRLLSVCS